MRRVRMWKVAAIAALVGALGVGIGVALAGVGDGGVIKACYSKTGSWRVISTSNPAETCKAGGQMLELYSKSGADAAFLDQTEAGALYLGKTAKAADAEMLDGLDSTALLGVNGKAADADKLDGMDSTAFVRTAQFSGTVKNTYQVWSNTTPITPGNIGNLVSSCDPDDVVLGGGYKLDTTVANYDAALIQEGPHNSLVQAWFMSAENFETTPGHDVFAQVYAICGEVAN
jgi:hypothetical protein